MTELEIMYLGRKSGVTINPDYLVEPLYFAAHGHKATLRQDLANRLMKDNPKMFMVTGKVLAERAATEEEALFSDEGLEGEDVEVTNDKPPSRMNKIDLAAYALEKHELVLDPDALTKAAMLAEINGLQE